MKCDRFAREGSLALERGEPLDPHYASCADCAAALRAYRAIAGDLGGLAADAAPSGDWQARVHARIARERAPRRRWWWLALPVAAAAALALWVTRPSPVTLGLDVQVLPGPGQARAETPKAGDRVAIVATVGGEAAELRVYRGDEVLLRCSDAPPCARAEGRVSAEFVLPGPGRYRTLLVVGEAAAPSGGLDADVSAARAAGARVHLSDEIAVW